MGSSLTNTPQVLTYECFHRLEFASSLEGSVPLLLHGQILHVTSLIRIVPGKRIVCSGMWGDKAVIAKVFFARNRALIHAKREFDGLTQLSKAGVIVPEIYYYGSGQDPRIHLLISKQILGSHLDNLQSTEERKLSLVRLVLEIATYHVLGVLQKDCHYENFLMTKKKIFTIDPGQMSFFSHPLSKKISFDNLALFFSQLGVGQTCLIKELFETYCHSRGWPVIPTERDRLFRRCHQWTLYRLEQFQQKLFRTSTHYVNQSNWRRKIMFERRAYTPEFQQLLHDPDVYMEKNKLADLKLGRSSTVVKVSCGAKQYIIKRYNIKNWMHALKRCLRTTRAQKNWRLGQSLHFLSLATARPVAYVEKSFFCCRGTSYLILEVIEGQTLGEFFQSATLTDAKYTTLAQKTVALIQNLALMSITHGDLKMTNILVDERTCPVLIDLDGMRFHQNRIQFNKAFKLEIMRFMKNWQDRPELKSLFSRYTKELNY